MEAQGLAGSPRCPCLHPRLPPCSGLGQASPGPEEGVGVVTPRVLPDVLYMQNISTLNNVILESMLTLSECPKCPVFSFFQYIT